MAVPKKSRIAFMPLIFQRYPPELQNIMVWVEMVVIYGSKYSIGYF